MRCKFCLQDKQLIKAHVIPKAFWPIKQNKETPQLVGSERGLSKRLNKGVYDETILCHECETKKFQEWDSYGVDFLKNLPITHTCEEEGQKAAIIIKDCDKSKFIMFCLSMLWRSSVSNHDYYKTVELGIYHENRLLNLLKQNDLAKAHQYSIIVSKFVARDMNSIPFLNPSRIRIEGVNCYLIYVSDFLFYIKVDKQKFTEPWSSLAIEGTKDLIILLRNFNESQELQVMRNMLKDFSVNHSKELK